MGGPAVNIQIFGSAKCFDTKKAQRYFKERGIPFQFIDLARKGLSPRELASVLTAVGGIGALLDDKAGDAALVRCLSREEDRVQKLFERPDLLRSPIVRDGRRATVGHRPEVWKTWEEAK